MTPAARVAAAIEILDAIANGSAAEQALTRWARASRYAGSKDRAAVRDHVFDALRRRQTAASLGGGTSGRALMLGLMRAQNLDPAEIFTGLGHAPPPLSSEELAAGDSQDDPAQIWDFPEALRPELVRSLEERAFRTAEALKDRAPITLRVNKAKTTRAAAREQLHAEGITSVENPLCDTALTVTDGARKLRNSGCYLNGLVELQDAASQAVVAALPAARKCLDFCAGGGGKALALAAQPDRTVYAHDAEPARMRDLQARAARAGCNITEVSTAALKTNAPYDLVLCDVPCSGSGAWRRSPDAKWRLTSERLAELTVIQDAILDQVMPLIAPQGVLAFATCSIFKAENEDRVAAFLGRHPNWKCTFERRFDVTPQGDGFYSAHLTPV
ncbi:MAG: RsmB/NOP family class I SAM-dependent RNA methyltransferase [Pseudomonadota bacterium]